MYNCPEHIKVPGKEKATELELKDLRRRERIFLKPSDKCFVEGPGQDIQMSKQVWNEKCLSSGTEGWSGDQDSHLRIQTGSQPIIREFCLLPDLKIVPFYICLELDAGIYFWHSVESRKCMKFKLFLHVILCISYLFCLLLLLHFHSS